MSFVVELRGRPAAEERVTQNGRVFLRSPAPRQDRRRLARPGALGDPGRRLAPAGAGLGARRGSPGAEGARGGSLAARHGAEGAQEPPIDSDAFGADVAQLVEHFTRNEGV